ncbi:hypothetical protein [Alicyclobacillus fodiniaquatilis]|uniref:HD domain-containing protein n=1 Tax=Alicyclobacillus fodiniaquatilis TaxID=1661150 RepID=A0ABW4JFI1_9BACL
MMDLNRLIAFARPFYADKDVMHDLSHIDRVINAAKQLLKYHPEIHHWDSIVYAAYFHGFIYFHEEAIRAFLDREGLDTGSVERIVTIAWESQKDELAESLEGRLLHDAHMIEGGKTYLIVKSLCTGTARGQTLEQTLQYFEKYVLGAGVCYLPEAQAVYAEMQQFASDFIRDLREGLKPV